METNQKMIQVTSSADSALASGKGTGKIVMQKELGRIHGAIESSGEDDAAMDCRVIASEHAKDGVAAISAPRVRPPPPFLQKVYDMVQSPELDSIISWSDPGTSFIIWNAHKFAAEVLIKYFKHNNFTSFVCQLNTYCFKKITWDRLEFQNEWFQKGKRRWLKNIKRRSQITQQLKQSTSVAPAAKMAPTEMMKEFEHLRQQHADLKVEIAKLREIQEKQEREMEALQRRGQQDASRQQKLVLFMNQAVLNLKEELYGAEALKKRRLDKGNSVDILVEVAETDAISSTSPHDSPMNESNAKNTCLAVDSRAKVQEQGRNSAPGSVFPDANASEYALLEKQLLEDPNGENLTEEEMAKIQPRLEIGMEDLIAGPADWLEFCKELTDKARSFKSHYTVEPFPS